MTATTIKPTHDLIRTSEKDALYEHLDELATDAMTALMHHRLNGHTSPNDALVEDSLTAVLARASLLLRSPLFA